MGQVLAFRRRQRGEAGMDFIVGCVLGTALAILVAILLWLALTKGVGI